MGIEAIVEIFEIEDCVRYGGDLTLSKSGVPISFEFRIEYKPNLVEAAKKSLSNWEEFVNKTKLEILYRSAVVELPHKVRSILNYFIGTLSIEFARSPERVNWRKNPKKALAEYLETNDFFIRDGVTLHDRVGLQFHPPVRYTAPITNTALEKFYAKCLKHGLH